ncbi:MAG: transcriptional repressor LexA [Candidatus Marinimicrobia bacterium]|jgi:repressor LexA|nr:transcriptional repressor LexA [Candidatus Neomarinimicrobiota bacterium]MDP6967330.1 transcriptional repressor LexA [Candidatus Neomarinimicrobiota bacterium]|tara:strand:- start:125 stop:721 length:597 start_codon:yes stop_codon:yes gene_type:complete
MYLTKRQKEILDYLKDFVSKNGYAPTFNEIAVAFDFRSKGTVYKHIKALKNKGLIQHEWNRTRAIEVIEESRESRMLPVLGVVAAGIPIEAIGSFEELELPDSFIRGGSHYVLKVSGNSMVDEQIRDGDLVIVCEKDMAENGETVVALIDGFEATIKKFFRRNGKVELRPANENLKSIELGEERVQIQGIVVGILRRY